jgi:hypothetical protein
LSNPISDEFLKKLREHGIIGPQEIVLEEGDLYIAKNVVSGHRRIVEVKAVMSESRRLLKG